MSTTHTASRSATVGEPRYDCAVNSIPIHERVELPESWIPADSRVEIDAKITAGRRTFSLIFLVT